jgi:hypothetical protein
VIDEHANPSSLRRSELGENRFEVIDSLKVFDNDALKSKVVSPNPFDEFGVVFTFNEDPAGQCDASSRIRDRKRP